MNSSKRYGLIIKKPKAAQQVKKAAIFGNESSDEEESAHKAVNLSLMKEAEKKKQMKQTQNEIRRAMEEDPTVYEYDNVYDEMTAKKQAAHVKVPEKDRKPKYIEGLLKSAAFRKRDYERQTDRQVQKEREKEGNEYDDKDAFVTEAYKKKMLEQAEEEERLKRQEALDAANDVTKQSDLSMFYRNLLNRNVSTGGEFSVNTKSESKVRDAEKKEDKSDRGEKDHESRGDRPAHNDYRHRDRRSDGDDTRSHRGSDKHDSRERKPHVDRRHQESEGRSRQYDEGNRHQRSSGKSERNEESSGSRKGRADVGGSRTKEHGQEHDEEVHQCKEKSSEQVQGKRENGRDKDQKGREEKAQSKFAKRSTQDTVMSAKDRYMARKREREAAKALHGSGGGDED